MFVYHYTQKTELPFSKIDFVIAWLLRELFALVLFAKALSDPEIQWRTGTFKLKWGGYVEEIPPKISPSIDDQEKMIQIPL